MNLDDPEKRCQPFCFVTVIGPARSTAVRSPVYYDGQRFHDIAAAFQARLAFGPLADLGYVYPAYFTTAYVSACYKIYPAGT